MSENEHQPDPAAVPPVWGRPATPVPQSAFVEQNGSPVDAVPLSGVPASDAQASGHGKKRISTMARTLTAVGVAAVIAVGGTIAVTSANASSSTAGHQGGPGTSGMGAPDGTGGMGGSGTGGTGTTGGRTGTGRGGMSGGFGEMAVIGSALHGEFVVADGTGTVTERIQTGALTAVSSTSIAVKSTDGFAATYVVGAALDVSAFTAGTVVTVIATVSGTTVTATSVTAARTIGSAPGATGSTGSTGTGSTGSGPPTI